MLSTMSLMFNLLKPRTLLICSVVNNVRSYSAKTSAPKIQSLGKKQKKIGKDAEAKYVFPRETNAEKLVTEVCGTNLLAKGGTNVPIKPDDQYPDWLWDIHIGKPIPTKDLDRNGKTYWNRIRKLAIMQQKYLQSQKSSISKKSSKSK